MSMIVEKDLVFFQIQWKSKTNLDTSVKRTRNLIEEWLKNEESELSLRDCGPAGNDVVYWAFKNGYQENREEMSLLFMHLRKLIKLLRNNDDVCKVWSVMSFLRAACSVMSGLTPTWQPLEGFISLI